MQITKKSLAVLIMLVTMSAQTAFAADEADAGKENIQDVAKVEVTGSRLAEEISDVPVPAYIVTREDIENSGAHSVQDVLERVPGVTGLTGSASMAQDKGITIRGLNTEVLLLIDGMPFMGANYGVGADLGSAFDLRSVPLESVERIEVVKGASSAIYGSNAAGGVINIITRKGGDKSSGSVKVEGGNGGWFRGSVRGTAVAEGDLKVTVGYTRTNETGDIRTRLVDPATGLYDHATDYKGNDYLFRVEKGPWSVLGEFGNAESKWDYTNFGVLEHDRQDNNYTRVSLNYADGVNTGRFYYHQNVRDIFDSSGETNYRDRTVGATFNRRQELGKIPFVWGLDWRREQADYSNANNPWGDNKPYDLARNGFAPYVEATVPVGEANLGLGLRYEHWNVNNGDNVDELVPRVSLNWESASGKLFYATAGRYFAMPSFFQMFYEDAWGTTIPNPNLKPEKGWTYDIGIKDAKAKHPWNIGIFYMDMEDKINYEYDPITWVGGYRNIDEYHAWGIEGQIKFNITEQWSYTQGFSWMDAEEKNAGADWARSSQPRWKASGFLNYKNDPWLVELAMYYYGDRVLANKIYDDEDIFTANLSVAWKQKNHTLRIACVNLFNKEYYINNAGYIIPERRLIASWEYEF